MKEGEIKRWRNGEMQTDKDLEICRRRDGEKRWIDGEI